jgi:hypothetical protein
MKELVEHSSWEWLKDAIDSILMNGCRKTRKDWLMWINVEILVSIPELLSPAYRRIFFLVQFPK